jgi:hypothetical protein
MRDVRNKDKILVEKSRGSPRIHRRIWEDNIKTDLKKYGMRAWTKFITQDMDKRRALVNVVMSLSGP